jgi:4-hydroxyacetophenone monooxygenase
MPINAKSLPIQENDDFIKRMVEDAELPALMMTLAHLTGDLSLIREEFRPPLKAMPTGAEAQGGMSPEIQAKARAAAVDAIIAYRDLGCPEPAKLSANEFRDVLAFLAGNAAANYTSLASHELNLPTEEDKLAWTKEQVAPGRRLRVAIIGAGMSGLVMAYRLRQAGISYVIFEKNSEVGGTWWENRYPGCRLDTSNFAYSYAFAQKNDWPYQYSPQETILEYLKDVTTEYELRKNIRFETEVRSIVYNENEKNWTLTVAAADLLPEDLKFEAVVLAVGQLNRPIIPDFPGAADFKGPVFHSAKWREDVPLENKNVAVIGTGASAFQIVPAICSKVKKLSVYQRTPAWMLPAPNYHKPLAEGLAWLFLHLPFYSNWFRFYQFWVSSEDRLRFFRVDENWQKNDSVSAENEKLRQKLHDHLAPQYTDRPDLLAKVIPTYPPGAKRMLRDNGVWAAALKRDNVELITTSIENFTIAGIRTSDGKERETDAVVLATGFSASDFYVPIRIVGKSGLELHDFWQEDARAGLGGCVPGFPNLFSVFGPNAALVVNGSIFFMSECCANYIVECLHLLLEQERQVMELKSEAFDAFVSEVDAENRRLAWGGVSRVSSWYRNRFGRSAQVWPFPLGEYWKRTRQPDVTDFNFS